jgi:Ser/Thr protein kinase RdoA (MazF antagonist)
MRSLAECTLLNRETALDLALLFDNHAVTKLLQNLWPELVIEQARGHYVRYKPLTNCLVHYEVTTAQGAESFYIKSYPSNASEKLIEAGDLPHRRVLAQERLVLHRFPDDAKLKQLMRFENDEQRQKLLHKVLPDVSHATFDLLAYKPERRLAMKASSKEQQVVLKCHTPDTFVTAKTKAEMVAAQQVACAPKLLGDIDRYGLLAFEWLDGALLRDLLVSPDFKMNTLQAVGAALANVHSQSFALPVCSQETNKIRSKNLVEYLSWLHPELSRRLCILLETLTTSWHPCEQTVTLHGDFYSEQILVRGTEVALLDFDEAHCGEAAYDMGLLMAHLEADVVRGFLPAPLLKSVKEHFLQGYEEAARYLPKNITAYTVMGMLSLLPHFFRNRYSNWPELMENFLTRAEHLASRETSAYALPV